jgi:hypothetical protein
MVCQYETLWVYKIFKNPVEGSMCSLHAIADAAREALKRSIVYLRGQSIGTVAAIDKSQGAELSDAQVTFCSFRVKALVLLSVLKISCHFYIMLRLVIFI